MRESIGHARRARDSLRADERTRESLPFDAPAATKDAPARRPNSSLFRKQVPAEALPLFRAEALDARRPRAYGRTLLVRPVSFTLLTAAAVAVGAAIVCFLIFGSYTRHTTLVGRLVPQGGVIKVYAPQPGTILEARAAEGEAVERGDVLFVISSERYSDAQGATHDAIGHELRLQTRTLEAQSEHVRRLETAERESLARMRSALELEASHLVAMIESQQERLQLADDAAARYVRMHSEGFVAEEHMLTRQDQLLEHASRLRSLERELAIVRRQLAELENQAESVPLKYQNQLAELDRALSGMRGELAENEARRLFVVRAPGPGIATAVAGSAGQVAEVHRPLMSIVPPRPKLEAHLYAPSSAIGFIEPGNPVLLRFDAYPYQRFGHHVGKVEAVSRTAVPLGELLEPLGERGGEPLYRVTVALSSQTITAYGEAHRLQPGMAVEADVLLETRRLYEWVLEPLYGLARKMH